MHSDHIAKMLIMLNSNDVGDNDHDDDDDDELNNYKLILIIR